MSLIVVLSADASEISFTCDSEKRIQDFTHTDFSQAPLPAWTNVDEGGSLDPNSPEDYLVKTAEERVILLYPYSSPIAFHLGTTGNQNLPTTRKLKAAIARAVSADIDPYLAIAVGFHESGPNNVDTFTSNLHDSALMRGLKCQQRKPSKNGPELVKYPKEHLLRRLVESERRGSTLEGKSWFCVGKGAKLNKDIGEYTLKKNPDPNYACCAEIGYSFNKALYDESPWNTSQSACGTEGSFGHIPCSHVGNFLFYHFIGSVASDSELDLGLNLSLDKKVNPAFRVQSILGFSKSTGLAMPKSIANWRLGHNSLIDPVYGHTVLDFYFQSILTNPWIRREVQKAEDQFKLKPKHLGCFNQKNSQKVTYKKEDLISKIASAKRFVNQHEKWKKNQAFLSGEQFALELEMKSAEKALGMSASTSGFEKRLEEYFRGIYQKRDTIKKVSQMNNPKFSWKEFTAEEIMKIRRESLLRVSP